MRTGKHTLGPFRVETPASSSGFGKAIYATRENGPDVFVAYVGNWKQDPATENADALLFASSENLLRTMKMLAKHMKEARKHNCPPDNYAIVAAERAISKAEGPARG